MRYTSCLWRGIFSGIARKVLDAPSRLACRKRWGHPLTARWAGQVPLPTLLWRDTLALGTFANLLMSFVGLILLAKGQTVAAVAIHFALMPLNIFLWLCINRLAGVPAWIRFGATIWLVFVTFI